MYALAAFLPGRILFLLDFLRKKKYDVRNRSIQKTHVLQIDTVNQKENLHETSIR